MKSKTLTWVIAVKSLTALTMPSRFVAQGQTKTHHHYQFIDGR